ncbi:MAG: DUF2071 domain-containing protein [Bacteroidetes bacterium]|jgi:hypothetical protein|nr:DUF2071 domain-containing protein [Bacteroidota bacterium]
MKTFLKAYWQDIVMVNYEVPANVLIPYMPYATELDDFEGKYFVSLVGFKFLHSSIFGIPIPFFGSFDEVNLRFYVKRTIGNEIRIGVVFVNETVPYKIVAVLANTLYREHYTYAKMKSSNVVENGIKKLSYQWTNRHKHNFINANFQEKALPILPGSHASFIYEHYYGFTKIDDQQTWEYKVNHYSWQTNENISVEIDCNFESMYGHSFAFLNQQQPHSVYNAIGSQVSIDWKINKIKR